MLEMKNDSGHFGEWITDMFEMPAYLYTCQQYVDKKAIMPTNTMWKQRNDHYHQVGNDRIVGFASNYGYFQLRQDEGGPKFLNDYHPQNRQFAGGFGYLVDAQDNIYTTFYTQKNDQMKRIFGMGYFQKEIDVGAFHLLQTIFAPFGDKPYVISQIQITNQTSLQQNIKWIEYWGGQMYQMTYRPVSAATMKKSCPGEAILMRREMDKNFLKKLTLMKHRTLICQRSFKGWKYPKNDILDIEEINRLILPTHDDQSYEDLNPPRVFLSCLSDDIDEIQTNADIFFLNGDIERPQVIFSSDDQECCENPALIMMKHLSLKPGETKTLTFVYGYLNKDDKLNDILNDASRQSLSQTMSCWKNENFHIYVLGEEWVSRETIWNYYYLRSGLTYDDYYQEHLLNQAGGYQYVMGFQGCPRDPLQHLLPLMFTHPHIAKEVIVFSLKLILPGGKIPMGISGRGCIFEEGFLPSDQELWYLWIVSEYILTTKDTAFAVERIKRKHSLHSKETVMDILLELYYHLVKEIGKGQHGLIKMLKGDWSNSILRQNVPSQKLDEVKETAESLSNSTMAVYALLRFAEMLEMLEYQDMAIEVYDYAHQIKQALRKIWNQQWFPRAFISDELGWIGKDELWLEPQPWAIIGDILSPQEASLLLKNIKELLMDPSPIGAMKRNVPAFSSRQKTDGQVWWSLNGTLIWALAKQKSEDAFEEWKKNSLMQHTRIYPDIWFGIWSGPDCYTSILSCRPGETRYSQSLVERMNNDKDKINGTYEVMDYSFIDFPISNLHAHAWPLYSFVKLLGIEFTKEGIVLSSPLSLPQYSFQTSLIQVIRTSHQLTGYYRPHGKTKCQWTIDLGNWDIQKITLYINNLKTSFQVMNENQISFVVDNDEWMICYE